MFWWFTHGRGDTVIRCESREVAKDVYELVVITPDGAERVERFSSSDALSARQEAMTAELKAQGWDSHGWNL